MWGIEADVSTGPSAEGVSGQAINVDYMTSLRGRLGIAMGDHLVYATAGAGLLFVSAQSSDSDDNSNNIIFRPVVGFGIESMLTPSISIKAEALAYIGNDGFAFDSSTGDEGSIGTVGIFRIGVKFQF